MKEKKYYICDFCKSEYDNKTECKKCEKRHKVPVSIEGKRYISSTKGDFLGYPSVLYVKMDDGQTIAYKRRSE